MSEGSMLRIAQLLDEAAFSDLPEQIPPFSEGTPGPPPVMGAGTITVTLDKPNQDLRKTVRILKGNLIPEEVSRLVDRLSPMLLGLFESGSDIR